MGCEVYANNMTIACKAADGQTIAAMPDVCLSPPTPPAGPIPVPYPNTAMASDTTNGSKTVQIGGKEVMLKNKSTFKKSMGDEAATKTLGMGVVSHQIQGEVNFCAWSMDVKFEGENVPRNLDLTLHNEMCDPANTPPWVYTDRIAMASASGGCTETIKAVDTACQKDADGKVACPSQGSMTKEQYALTVEKDPCQRAARCLLTSYSPSHCCDPQTPHHLVPKAGFFDDKFNGKFITGNEGYLHAKAPCVCAEGGKSQGTHGLLHDAQTRNINANFPGKDRWKFSDAVKNAATAMKQVCPQCKEEGCIESQLRNEHKNMGIDDGSDVKPIRQQPSDISSFKATFEALQKTFAAAADGGAAV